MTHFNFNPLPISTTNTSAVNLAAPSFQTNSLLFPNISQGTSQQPFLPTAQNSNVNQNFPQNSNFLQNTQTQNFPQNTPNQNFPQNTPNQNFLQNTPNQNFLQNTPNQNFPQNQNFLQNTPNQNFPQNTQNQNFPQNTQNQNFPQNQKVSQNSNFLQNSSNTLQNPQRDQMTEKLDKNVIELLKPILEYDQLESQLQMAEEKVECIQFEDYCTRMTDLGQSWCPMTSTVDRLGQDIRFFGSELGELESFIRQLEHNLSPGLKEERGMLLEKILISRVDELVCKMSQIKSKLLRLNSESELFFRLGLDSPESSNQYYSKLADLTHNSIGDWEMRLNQLATVIAQLENAVEGLASSKYFIPGHNR